MFRPCSEACCCDILVSDLGIVRVLRWLEGLVVFHSRFEGRHQPSVAGQEFAVAPGPLIGSSTCL